MLDYNKRIVCDPIAELVQKIVPPKYRDNATRIGTIHENSISYSIDLVVSKHPIEVRVTGCDTWEKMNNTGIQTLCITTGSGNVLYGYRECQFVIRNLDEIVKLLRDYVHCRNHEEELIAVEITKYERCLEELSKKIEYLSK